MGRRQHPAELDLASVQPPAPKARVVCLPQQEQAAIAAVPLHGSAHPRRHRTPGDVPGLSTPAPLRRPDSLLPRWRGPQRQAEIEAAGGWQQVNRKPNDPCHATAGQARSKPRLASVRRGGVPLLLPSHPVASTRLLTCGPLPARAVCASGLRSKNATRVLHNRGSRRPGTRGDSAYRCAAHLPDRQLRISSHSLRTR
jgi:hypothetical protein